MQYGVERILTLEVRYQYSFIYALLGRKKHFLFEHTRKVYASLIKKKRIAELKNKDGDVVIKNLMR